MRLRKHFPHAPAGALVALFAGAILLWAAAASAVNINEIRIDQTSTDNDEYFELAGNPSESLAGLTYLVIGDGTGACGVIEAVVDLGAYSIQADGLFVMGEATATLFTPDAVGSLNFENSDNVTHMLVSGFTGANGDDLDTDDDGVLDVTPWTAIVDAVGLDEGTTPDCVSNEYLYSAVTVGPDGPYVPGHVYYCGGGWLIGPFDPASGVDTPGDPNVCGNLPPEVTDVYHRPLWVEPGETVTVTADASDQDGTVTAVDLYYRVNAGGWTSTAMVLGTGTTYTATIPSQVDGTVVDYYVQATDDGAATATNPIDAPTGFYTITVQGEVITPIATIQADPATYQGSLVIVQAQVYIPGDYKADGSVNAYVQDGSGRGINVYGDARSTGQADLNDNGNVVKITGYVDLYFTTTELVNYQVELVGIGNPPLSPAVQGSTLDATASTNEGTYIEATGVITAIDLVGGAHNFTINDGSGPLVVRVDDDLRTDLDTGFAVDDEITASGAGATYSGQGQIIVGYGTEIVNNGSVGDVLPPVLLTATLTAPTVVTVAFDESIDPTTGNNALNYEVYETATPANTIAVSAAAVSTPDSLVVLTLGSAVPSGVPHTVRVNNVEDLNNNVIAANSTAPIFDPVAPEDIVINEIMQNPFVLSDLDGEWFEIYNAGSVAVDIEGWTIQDAGSDSHLINSGGSLLIQPGEYKVLGVNAAAMLTEGVTLFYEYSGIALANGDDEIILLNSALQEVDRVEYDGGVLWPDPIGNSMQWTGAGDNNDGTQWSSEGAPVFGTGDRGTPGAENDFVTATPVVRLQTELMGNYPNPFNPATAFRFRLQTKERATLGVYNLRGQLVCIVVDEVLEAGLHEDFVWNGLDQHDQPVTSGTYFYRLVTESGYEQSRKMTLLK